MRPVESPVARQGRPAPVLTRMQPAAGPMRSASWLSDHDSSIRRAGLTLGLCMLFVRVSFLHQLIHTFTGVNTRLLYILGVPILLATLGTGGAIRRAFRGGIGFGWVGFSIWLLFTVVFSVWPGGSATLVLAYIRTSLPMLVITAGFTMTWKDCERAMCAVSAAGFLNVLSAKLFQQNDSGRLSMEAGTIANSNDLAAHLLFVAPFLIYTAFRPGTRIIYRVASLVGVAGALYSTLSTGSRGGVIGLAGIALAAFFLLKVAGKVGLVVAGAVAAAALVALLPPVTLNRLTSFTNSETADPEAIASSEARRYLLEQGIQIAISHPLFGVGPGQFSDVVGEMGKRNGIHIWQETHNFFTQIASECGIPALLLYLTGVVLAIGRIIRTFRRAGTNPANKRVRWLCFCLLLSVVGFSMSSVFLNLAYQFYWLVLSGLAISTADAAQAEFFDVPVASH